MTKIQINLETYWIQRSFLIIIYFATQCILKLDVTWQEWKGQIVLWTFFVQRFSHMHWDSLRDHYSLPLSMEFSRKAYWSGLPFPSPGDLPDPGIKPRSPTLQTDSLPPEPSGKPLKMRMLALTPCSSGLLCFGRGYKLKAWSLELSSSTEAQPDGVQAPGD